MFGGKVQSKQHLRYGQTVRSAKSGGQARAALDRVAAVQTNTPMLTLEVPASDTTQRKASNRARRPERDGTDRAEEPSPDKKSGAKEVFSKPCKRGTVFQVKMRGTYGAGKTYDWQDVVRIGEKIFKKEMKLSWLKPDHKKHDPSTMNVPYGTMKEWGMDDHDYMTTKHGKGVDIKASRTGKSKGTCAAGRS